MTARPSILIVAIVALSMAVSLAGQPNDAAPAAAGDQPADRLILHAGGYWRCFITFRKPVVRTGDNLKTTEFAYDTELPPKDWPAPEFDDRAWVRFSNPPFPPGDTSSYGAWVMREHNAGWVVNDCSAPSLAVICVRGRFSVDDPSKAKDLKLSVEYRGGVVVYLNGREIARGNLPAKSGIEEIAEDYPPEAFLNVDGGLLANEGGKKNPTEKDEKNLQRWALHTRKIENVTVPKAFLRKGVNVLAVEVHRSPYHEKCLEVIPELKGWTHQRIPGIWSTCGLRHVRLEGPLDGGVSPNVVRPQGLQVWNSDLLTADADLDWGDPNEPLQPVRIVAARNGSFSGKVMIGSTEPVEGLSARISDLRQADGGGAIPASSVQIRYPLSGSGTRYDEQYSLTSQGFGDFPETPPEKIPVAPDRKSSRANWALPGTPAPVMGAVQPVWMTVAVPRDAAPGEYAGTLTISARGQENIEVPVWLVVAAFTLCDPKDYTTLVDLVESPESVALRYKTPLWSDEHFRKIEKSMALMGYLGCDTAYLHLIARTDQGNEETIVRWIDRGGGRYEYDFTAMDRYLDLVEKHLGKPRMLCLYVWDIPLDDKKNPVLVTGVDPATGEVKSLDLPNYSTPEGKNIWGDFMKTLLGRLEKRGLGKSVRMGLMWDRMPTKEIIDEFAAFAPGVKWMRHSHSERNSTDIAYNALVWAVRYVETPNTQSLYGWKSVESDCLKVQFRRSTSQPPVLEARLLAEKNIQGEQCGFGRVGVDFWGVLEKRGKTERGWHQLDRLIARYPETGWYNLDIMTPALFSDGPEGARSAVCVEMIREGLQECEARICIERALTEEALLAKLGDELAERCRRLTEERTRDVTVALDSHMMDGFSRTRPTEWGPFPAGRYYWLSTDWQARSEKLYSTAAEVAAKIEAR